TAARRNFDTITLRRDGSTGKPLGACAGHDAEKSQRIGETESKGRLSRARSARMLLGMDANTEKLIPRYASIEQARSTNRTLTASSARSALRNSSQQDRRHRCRSISDDAL
ncbi:hypothetical protein LTR87_017399, partial [Friedmanniomyces endolithicus]